MKNNFRFSPGLESGSGSGQGQGQGQVKVKVKLSVRVRVRDQGQGSGSGELTCLSAISLSHGHPPSSSLPAVPFLHWHPAPSCKQNHRMKHIAALFEVTFILFLRIGLKSSPVSLASGSSSSASHIFKFFSCSFLQIRILANQKLSVWEI